MHGASWKLEVQLMLSPGYERELDKPWSNPAVNLPGGKETNNRWSPAFCRGPPIGLMAFNA